MLKKHIAYEDFDGNAREEDFYFNLTEADLTNMFTSVDGGLEKKLTRIMQAKSQPELMANFRDVIRLSYGVKSADGRTFRKSDELFEEFAATNAYSKLFMELLSDEEVAAEFVAGILPKSLGEEVRKQNALRLAEKSNLHLVDAATPPAAENASP